MVSLRAVEPGDVDALYRLETDPSVRRVSWGECPVSRHLMWEYARNYTADICRDRQLRLVVEIDGAFAGTVDITDYDPANSRAMLGIGLLPEWRGRGLGAEALRQCLDVCRSLRLVTVAAMVPADNQASLRLFAAAGFERAGLLRRWLADTDVAVLQTQLR